MNIKIIMKWNDEDVIIKRRLMEFSGQIMIRRGWGLTLMERERVEGSGAPMIRK